MLDKAIKKEGHSRGTKPFGSPLIRIRIYYSKKDADNQGE
jgi:hypothetical protein